jgi:hypothetical protein
LAERKKQHSSLTGAALEAEINTFNRAVNDIQNRKIANEKLQQQANKMDTEYQKLLDDETDEEQEQPEGEAEEEDDIGAHTGREFEAFFFFG